MLGAYICHFESYCKENAFMKDKYPKRIDKWIAIISAVVVICLVAILIVGDIIYNVRIGRGE